jgi:beta-galactosidase
VEYSGPVTLSGTADWPLIKKGVPIRHLENHGLWRGIGVYELAPPHADVLLKGVGDVVSAHVGDAFLGTRVSCGQWQRYSAPPSSHGEWRFRTEIWGHSNFDDPRLPGLRIRSTRGIEAAYRIMEETDITSGWLFEYLDKKPGKPLSNSAESRIPFWSVNSWNGTRVPMLCSYRRRMLFPSDRDAFVLSFEGNKAMTEVEIDMESMGAREPHGSIYRSQRRD